MFFILWECKTSLFYFCVGLLVQPGALPAARVSIRPLRPLCLLSDRNPTRQSVLAHTTVDTHSTYTEALVAESVPLCLPPLI